MEEYISLAEAAEGTPYSQEYLSLLARKGKIDAKKIGRNWHTTKLAVAGYLDEQKIKLLAAVEEKSTPSDIKPDIVSDSRQVTQHTPAGAYAVRKSAGLILEEVPDDQEWEAAPAIYRIFSSGAFKLFLSIIGHTFFVGAILAGFFVIGVFGANLVHERSFESAQQKSQADLQYLAAAAGERIGILEFAESRLRIVAGALKDTGDIIANAIFDLTGIRREPVRPLLAVPSAPSKSDFNGDEVRLQARDDEDASKSDFTGDAASLRGEAEAISEIVVPSARDDRVVREVFIPADFALVKSEVISDVERLNKSLRERFDKAIDDLTFKLSRTSSRTESSIQMVTLSQKIDNLDGVTLKNVTFSGASGLTDSDIPNAITITGSQTLSSLSLTDDLTTSGDLTFSSSATTTIPSATKNAFSIATSSASVPFLTFDTSSYRVGIGTSTPGRTFSVGGDAIISGTLDVGGVFRANSSSLTVNNVPTTAHTFATWAVNDGGASATTSSLVINPSSAIADTNLLGLLVNNQVKFLVDAEGDVFANGLTTAGSVTTGSTTQASVLIEGSTYIGDAITDLFSINSGNIVFNNRATSTIPNLTVNAWSIATSSAIVPTFTISTAASPFGLVGIGTTSPFASLSIQAPANHPALAIGSSSATSFIVAASGNVGIGTTSPQGILTLGSGVLTIPAGSGSAPSLTFNDDTNLGIYRVSADYMGFTANGITTLSITSTNARMENGLPFLLSSGTAALPSLILDNDASGSDTGLFSPTTANNIAISTAGVERLRIDSSGNVGIGTTSPAQLLSVAGSGYLTGGLGVGIATTTSGNLQTSGIINIGGTGTSTFANGIQLTQGCLRGPDNLCVGGLTGGSANRLAYWTSTSALSQSADLSWNNARFGIGTSTPGSLISFSGDGTASTSLLLSGINMIYASSSTTTIPSNINALSFATSTQAGNLTILSIDGSSTYGRVGVGTSTPGAMLAVENLGTGAGFIVSDAANDTTPFIIDASGNVGIGVASPGVKLEIAGTGDHAVRIDSLTADQPGHIDFREVGVNRARICSPNAAANCLTDAAQGDLVLEGATGIRFGVNGLDGATDVIINSLGNVGIGTAVPASGVKLDVAGQIQFNVDITADTTIGLCKFQADGTATDIDPVECNGTPGDLAEWYETEIGTEAGDIVSVTDSTIEYSHDDVDPKTGLVLHKATSTVAVLKKADGGSTMIGVISTSPWQSFGKGVIEVGKNPQPVALVGRVPVKVSTESGAIKIGDRITSSSLAGIGMKATVSGQTVGIALENFDPASHPEQCEGSNGDSSASPQNDNGGVPQNDGGCVGKILVFVNLGYSRLDGALTNADLATNAWSIDQVSGKVNVTFYGDVNLNGNSIINVSKILGMDGKWKIDSDGTMIAVRVITDEVVTKHLAVSESVKLGSPEKRIGITLYDEATGEPYCLKMRNGVMVSEIGECKLVTGNLLPETFEVSPPLGGETSTTPNATSETAEVGLPSGSPTSNAETATTTEPVEGSE